jgi:hypothetical protein
MRKFRLNRECRLPLPPAEVFPFFADAANLEHITPPWLNFRMVSHPGPMFEGALISYRLRWGPFPMRWLTRITKWDPPHEFADFQERGPYRLWHHTHRFLPENGGTRMIDIVDYALPLGRLGVIAERLFVRRDIERIFEHRNRVIGSIFQPGKHVEVT